jgi:hypothetical protein
VQLHNSLIIGEDFDEGGVAAEKLYVSRSDFTLVIFSFTDFFVFKEERHFTDYHHQPVRCTTTNVPLEIGVSPVWPSIGETIRQTLHCIYCFFFFLVL